MLMSRGEKNDETPGLVTWTTTHVQKHVIGVAPTKKAVHDLNNYKSSGEMKYR